MQVEELLKKCDKSISMFQETANIALIMPGRWGKRNTRRLCKGGPVGEIVSDNFNGPGVIVMFNAVEVKKFVLEKGV